MKNLFLAVSFLIVATTQAQVRNYTKKSTSSSSMNTTVKKSKSSSSDEKSLQLLVLAGAQSSTQTGGNDDDLSDNTSRFGFAGGLGLNKNLGNLLDLEIDAMYGTMGTVFESGDPLELSYIQAPILLNFKLSQSGFKLGIGPQVGFLLTAIYADEDVSEIINSFDAGGVVNATIPFSSKLGMNVRYYYGLTNAFKDSTDVVVTNSAIYAGLYLKI